MLRRSGQLPVKTDEEVQRVRESCVIAATVLDKLCKMVAPGLNTYDLDQEGKKLIEGFGAESACYNYVGSAKAGAYPGYTCLSINDEVVHGIGSMKRVLRPGDNITVDVVVRYNDFIGDNARTVIVGHGDEAMTKLVKTTEEALYHGISFAKAKNRVGDISNAVQKYVEKNGMSVVRDFVGHGVGRSMHEDPQIPNYGRRGSGPKLHAGMTIAIEPMVNLGAPPIQIGSDGWTASTADGLPAAHFEHTVLITEGDAEILTIPEK
ncbi:type I methionyl aminopeptidase [Rubellicoccus peritrichatus]|uniref:Methionine aminopeptidase n=1 Tax=Rubellicoccus peritrichatus TaxID=3080537 RepID=A0AAQ3LEZ3_9BACT|nr:type I methionyl aminopeptidase [Puniceicoccus sp. CR14]WOO43507.1 type I methionyl aminopeptidase [Puniceicoccus sp. CR14]